ncbi:Dabb family protein [Streptomyces sp. JV176]|uniref:Dabb family protein n=1 Tax=Streptomyces sp. JV176 TaxID=858630 RepID=UPI002E75C298|nr:Dabb family protein [Streptomyces sp. JV176]MEE1804195.1 Dabb family protein [Streptomyces sp. JV176]
MIRHIVLFKFKPGFGWQDSAALAAERSSLLVGERVPGLLHWQVGRNTADRPIAYDFAVIGLLPDQDALRSYQDHPFHQESATLWQAISTWVVADIEE